jgi:hypothetical protein
LYLAEYSPALLRSISAGCGLLCALADHDRETVNSSAPQTKAMVPRNRFDRMEWAGAFGDLGTLVPFIVAYIAVLKMDPFGILFAFGTALLICGLYYKTPFPDEGARRRRGNPGCANRGHYPSDGL